MGRDKDNLIWAGFFSFPRVKDENGNYIIPSRHLPESLAWTKYADPVPQKVHELGCKTQSEARQKDPNSRKKYLGYIDCLVAQIRELSDPSGHKFDVRDAPDEGDHHVEVDLILAPDRPWNKAEVTNLKATFTTLFSPLTPHSCGD